MQQLLKAIEFTINISVKLQDARSEHEVYSILKEEFARTDYVMVVFAFSDDGTKIVLTEADAKFDRFRSTPGMKIEGVEIDAARTRDYVEQIKSGRTFQLSFKPLVETALPYPLAKVVYEVVGKGMGLEMGICSPLYRHGKVAGIFYMATPNLSDFLVIPVKSLTEHISNALERVELEAERKRVEGALKESMQRMADIIDFLPDATFVIDMGGRVVAWNRAIEKMTGIKAEAIKGKGGYEYALPFHGIRRPVLIDLVLKPDRDLEGRYTHFKNVGGVITAETKSKLGHMWVTASTLYDSNGNAVGAIESMRDISDVKKAEEALRFQNVLLTTQQDTSIDGILIVDDNAKIINYNQQFVSMWAIPPNLIATRMDGPVLQSVLDKITEPQLFLQKVQHLYKNKQEKSRDEFLLKDGRIIDRYSAPMFGADGRYYGRIWYFRDITEKKKYEESLKERDVRLTKFGTQVPGMLYQFMMRPDGTFCVPFTTDGIKNIFGCSPEDVKESFEPILKTILPEDKPMLIDSIEYSAKHMTPWQCEYRAQLPGQPIRWLWGKSIPERMPDGSIIWHGFNTDVTERISMNVALQSSNERFKQVTEYVEELVWEVDATGMYTYVNTIMEKMLGYSPEEVVGKKHFYDFFHPNDKEDLKRAAFSVFKKKGPFKGLINRNIAKNGRVVWLSTSAVPVVDNDGKLQGYRGADIDITKRKKLERENKKYAEHLEELVKERTRQLEESKRLAAIGETATMVWHDLRNPLQSIVNTMYYLNEMLIGMPNMPLKGEVNRSFERMTRNIGYMNKIVSDLTDYGRPMMINLTAVNIKELVDETLADIKIPKTVAIRLLIGEGHRIEIDIALMKRAFTNLILNAIQAMPNGGTVTISAKRVRDRDSMQSIIFKDEGVGMPDEVKAKLFKPLITNKPKGMGMGLAVVKRIIDAHKGQISVESEVGKWTEVTVTLPISQSQ